MSELTREEVDAKLDASAASIRAGFAELRADMAAQNGQTQAQMAEIRAEMHKGAAEIIKWVIGTGLTFVAVTISVLTFVVKTSAPIVVTAPPAASTQK